MRAQYRYIDAAGIVHLEKIHLYNGDLGFQVVCGRMVLFGAEWDDNHRLVVTCLPCVAKVI